MSIPVDYVERVYAGVLGKLIGVYLGRPVEGWTYGRINREIGAVDYYVNDRLMQPLVVTDDDLTGTFTFPRALWDYDFPPDLTPAQIGQTWLNYTIENRTIFWWGGLGNSTEHTAYLRLKNGIAAPQSGSIALNGKVVAEQIGAQIFVDGWAMLAPGDPETAAELARRASSVSHDGEAIYAAQALAAMEAQAFVESDVDRLVDTALRFIPAGSVICKLVNDIRNWHAREPDWRHTRQLIEERYGYHLYGGNCHVVPNHALIHLGLWYGEGNFQQSLMIVNTSGWDTDCNSGNLGCLLGIRNGLAGIDRGRDWRGPVGDRLYLPTADGGRAITDAVQEAVRLANAGRIRHELPPLQFKGGARFHFELAGAVQGFRPDPPSRSGSALRIENVAGYSRRGGRSLALRFGALADDLGSRAATPTFIPPEAIHMPGYELLAAPTLYPGQIVRAGLFADAQNSGSIRCGLFVRYYGDQDRPSHLSGPTTSLAAGAYHEFQWLIPNFSGGPIMEIGVQAGSGSAAHGSLYLDYLTWDGEPDVTFVRPHGTGAMALRAWVNAADRLQEVREGYRIIHNRGTGLVMTGTREWQNYRVTASLTPHLLTTFGLAARVQGLRRYYALLLGPDRGARLVKAWDTDRVLAQTNFSWEWDQTYALALHVAGDHLEARIGGELLFDVTDAAPPRLQNGGIGLLCEAGCLDFHEGRVIGSSGA